MSGARIEMGQALTREAPSIQAGAAKSETHQALRHVEELDGLRGFAIVLVMLFHMRFVPPVGSLALLWSSLCARGGLGVDVFFVLSGFLITGILVDALPRPHYFRNFYGRRALRIFPLYYAVLAFAFVILPRIAPFTVARYEEVNRDSLWYWLHLSNFAIARRGAFVHGIVDVSWSLSIEEQFYLVWPAVVRSVSTVRLRSLCVCLVLVSVVSRALLTLLNTSPVAIYTLTFCRFDGLAIGALVALLIRGRSPSAIRALWVRGLLVAGALCFLLVLPLEGSIAKVLEASGSHLTVCVLTSCAILAALSTPNAFFIRPFRWRALRLFGRYSYALYLFHYPISAALRDYVLTPSRMPTVLGSSLPSVVFFYLVAGGASLVAAMLSWHLYEQRFLRLKRLFA